MISDGTPSSNSAAPGKLPTRQTLAERIQQHQEEKRRSLASRRRLGMSVPTEAEVASVLASREAAAARAHDAQLQDDLARVGVTALRCYYVMPDASAEEIFQAPAQLSDVQARLDLVRPLNKLMAILALRLRLASVLRTVEAARSSKHLKEVHTSDGDFVAVEGEGEVCARGAFPPPTASSLPQLSTLLRELPLPNIAAHTGLSSDFTEHAAVQLFDVPRRRPFHDAFLYRLRHFAPVGLPAFALDISAQADKETQPSTATTDLQESDVTAVPVMDAPQPQSLSSPQAGLIAADVEGTLPTGGPMATLARVSADTRNASHGRWAAVGQSAADADAETFPSLLPNHARAGYVAGLIQPQTL